MKRGVFELSKAAQKAFEVIQQKLYQAPILAVLNFEDLFELECDARGAGRGVILIQSKRPFACFSKTLNCSRCNYRT